MIDTALFLLAGLLVLLMMTILWLWSLVLRDSSIVDPFWGTGFVVVAWFYAAFTFQGSPARSLLLLVMVSIWGLRLSLYLLARSRGRGEDPRYANWRREAGPSWWWRSYFKVFLLQGLLMWLISVPFLAIQSAPTPVGLTWLDIIGLLLWMVGFFFEFIGDWQLARFKRNPQNEGQVLDRGLWRYTRHPNYFGEALLWWGYGALALAAGAWWALFSPLLMTLLLLRVSGVTMLERSLKKDKPGYAEYIARTSAFIPRPPRKA